MKILAIEKEISGVEEGDYIPFLKQEADRVWELYQAGVIREPYFRQDQTSAVLILECEDIKDANSALNSLPLVREGLIAFDIIPLRAYPGFSRLFSST